MSKADLKSFELYFLKLGATGYGGPNALAEKMRVHFVEKTNALSSAEFEKGFGLSQLLPGPLAAKLCVYLMYRLGGSFSAARSLALFVLPSTLFIFLFSFIYARFGLLPSFVAVAKGMTPAVLALTLFSLVAPSRRQIRKNPVSLGILYLASGFTFVTFSINLALLLLAGGALYAMGLRRPKPGTLHQLVPVTLLGQGLFLNSPLVILGVQSFIAGAFVFGGGNAIIPFFESSLVHQYKLIDMRQFLDGLTLGMMTPGPVLVAATFFGFISSGPVGAIIATIAVFLPSILIVILFAKHYDRMMANQTFANFSIGATTCALGATTGAIMNLSARQISSAMELIIFVVSMAAVATRRVPDLLIVLMSGLVAFVLGLPGF